MLCDPSEEKVNTERGREASQRTKSNCRYHSAPSSEDDHVHPDRQTSRRRCTGHRRNVLSSKHFTGQGIKFNLLPNLPHLGARCPERRGCPLLRAHRLGASGGATGGEEGGSEAVDRLEGRGAQGEKAGLQALWGRGRSGRGGGGEQTPSRLRKTRRGQGGKGRGWRGDAALAIRGRACAGSTGEKTEDRR